MRRLIAAGLMMASALLSGGALRAQQPSQVVLRMGTLVPRSAPLERAVNTWNHELDARTHGTLRVQVFWGGTMGDERSMVRRMRIGQLDAANVSSIGLAIVVPQVAVLQVPGLYTSYESLDRVRAAVGPELAQAFEGQGFHLLGWGDSGRIRIFSRQRILRPTDLRTVRPWVPTSDVVFGELLRVVGANGVTLPVGEVFGGLRTGMIDTVPATALAVVALQWSPSISYMTAQSDGFLIGGMLLRRPFLDGLSSEQRQALEETAAASHDRFIASIRATDERAFDALVRRGVQQVDMSPHAEEWVRVAAETRRRLVGRVYPAELLERVERIAAESP